MESIKRGTGDGNQCVSLAIGIAKVQFGWTHGQVYFLVISPQM